MQFHVELQYKVRFLIINKMEKIMGIYERICPMTIMLNAGAIGLSMSDVELTLKLLSYSVAIIWTTIKVIKEIKNWRE